MENTQGQFEENPEETFRTHLLAFGASLALSASSSSMSAITHHLVALMLDKIDDLDSVLALVSCPS